MKSFCTISILLCAIAFTRSEPVRKRLRPESLPPTRRILNGKEAGETRPYMVYLRPGAQAEKLFSNSKWLCGGVIIDPRFILTSAACIEDVKNFYVVSGTSAWSSEENDCIKNGAKKAVWKCVPKDYFFDGADFDNINWMSGDIAVVKVEDEFNFNKRVLGCEYIPKMIKFNNVSQDYENSWSMATVAGWGSVSGYGDPDIGRSSQNSYALLETDVQIISKTSCKKLWEPRYHDIIDQSMICTKDEQDDDRGCLEGGVSCKEIDYSVESEEANDKKFKGLREHKDLTSRRFKVQSGGTCENDHGGPLIVGHGATSMVVGVISASMTKPNSMTCYGPYLYTSIWNFRHLISCAIDKDAGHIETCRKSFGIVQMHQDRISEVTFDWKRNIPKN